MKYDDVTKPREKKDTAKQNNTSFSQKYFAKQTQVDKFNVSIFSQKIYCFINGSSFLNEMGTGKLSEITLNKKR